MLDVNNCVNLAALLRATSTGLLNLEAFIKTVVDFRQLLVRRSFFQATALRPTAYQHSSSQRRWLVFSCVGHKMEPWSLRESAGYKHITVHKGVHYQQTTKQNSLIHIRETITTCFAYFLWRVMLCSLWDMHYSWKSRTEAEEKFGHRTNKVTKYNQAAAIRWMKLTLSLP
jgi:hypothetical protein